jgi:hypothetical protein
MTEDQQMAGIKSLAVELDRLAHLISIRDDDVAGQAIDLAFIIRKLGGGQFCAHSLNALAKLVHYLVELGHHQEHDEKSEAH